MKLLSTSKIEQIDTTAREILNRVGIRVLDESTCKQLRKAGAKVDLRNLRVRIPDKWLDTHLATAPASFTLYSRDDRHDLSMGTGKVYFGNGGRAFQILDTDTGQMRPTVSQDIADTACLVDQLPNIHFFIIPCQAHNIPADGYHLQDFFQAFNNTTKHVMGGCDSLAGIQQMHKLAAIIAGGGDTLRKRPFVSVITNFISPLTIDAETIKIIKHAAANGIPLTCAPAPIAGATAPATLAGTLAQLHAEALAGVALTQFFGPGACVLYGAVPSTMDLRSMNLAIGSVETTLLNTAAVALAKRYRLPIYASSGLTDAKMPDIQAGFEKGVSNLMVGLAGADFIHLAAGMLDSGNAIALEQYVIDDEIMGMIYRILRGIDVTKETLGLECIDQVGPGGNFVLEDHTLDHMMDQYFYPGLSIRMPYDLWNRNNRPTPVSRAREQAAALLSRRVAKLEGKTLARMDRMIK